MREPVVEKGATLGHAAPIKELAPGCQVLLDTWEQNETRKNFGSNTLRDDNVIFV
jgi:hypothetical protein